MTEPQRGQCTKNFRATGSDMANLRNELRLNQRDFAKFLGVPLGTVATWERRKNNHLSGPANVLYHLAESKTRDLRTDLKKVLLDLKREMAS